MNGVLLFRDEGLKHLSTPDLSIDFQLGNDLLIKVLPETLVREPAWQ